MDPATIQKIETFTKVAMDRVSELEGLLQEKEASIATHVEKEAAELKKQAALTGAIQKAAKAMYEADYITEDNGETFMKKAMENPAHMARIIERLCEASSVIGMGKVSSVRAMAETGDPVIRRMLGGTSASPYSIVDEE